jgi:hypothetical protein
MSVSERRVLHNDPNLFDFLRIYPNELFHLESFGLSMTDYMMISLLLHLHKVSCPIQSHT